MGTIRRSVAGLVALVVMAGGLVMSAGPAHAAHWPCEEDGFEVPIPGTGTTVAFKAGGDTVAVCVLVEPSTHLAFHVNLHRDDPKPSKVGMRVQPSACVTFGGCVLLAFTGAEVGSVEPITGQTTGAESADTCVWVNNIQVSPNCGSFAGATVAPGDLTPQPVLDTTPSTCLVTLGALCVGPPSQAKVQLGRDTENNTAEAYVGSSTVPVDLPENTCVGVGCP